MEEWSIGFAPIESMLLASLFVSWPYNLLPASLRVMATIKFVKAN